MSGKTKQQLLAQKIISVCNPDFPTPEMVEFIGEIGFDLLFIDCEHSTTDYVHQKQFMARGSQAFLQGIRGET